MRHTPQSTWSAATASQSSLHRPRRRPQRRLHAQSPHAEFPRACESPAQRSCKAPTHMPLTAIDKPHHHHAQATTPAALRRQPRTWRRSHRYGGLQQEIAVQDLVQRQVEQVCIGEGRHGARRRSDDTATGYSVGLRRTATPSSSQHSTGTGGWRRAEQCSSTPPHAHAGTSVRWERSHVACRKILSGRKFIYLFWV